MMHLTLLSLPLLPIIKIPINMSSLSQMLSSDKREDQFLKMLSQLLTKLRERQELISTTEEQERLEQRLRQKKKKTQIGRAHV